MISARVLTAPTGAFAVGVVVMATESQAARVLEVLASEDLEPKNWCASCVEAPITRPMTGGAMYRVDPVKVG